MFNKIMEIFGYVPKHVLDRAIWDIEQEKHNTDEIKWAAASVEMAIRGKLGHYNGYDIHATCRDKNNGRFLKIVK